MSGIAGAYVILEEIGSGRTATVYRARRLSGDGAEVALKVLHRHLALDSTLKERFRREAEIARQLVHPNVLPIYDIVAWDESPALVMELCPGGSLEGAGPMPGAELLAIARQAASALDAAHRLGIVHRDLKPANLLRAAGGSVKLCDFGSARVSSLLGLTRSTVSFGSPEFTAPESLSDTCPDPRWDLYSLGAVLYRLGTGRPHFDLSLLDLLSSRPDPEPPDRSNPGIGRALGEAILSLLAPVESRPGSAAEFLAAIDALCADVDGTVFIATGGAHRGDDAKELIEKTAALAPRGERKECLFCGRTMPFSAPVCLACGEEDIVFERCSGPEAEALFLDKLPEDSATMERFFRILRAIADDPALDFRFITEDKRLYSREERRSSVALPAKLLFELRPETTDRLIRLFEAAGRIHLTRHPLMSRKAMKLNRLVEPRRCPVFPAPIVAAIKLRAKPGEDAIAGRGGAATTSPADLALRERAFLAAGRAAKRSLHGEAAPGRMGDTGSMDALLEACEDLMAKTRAIRRGLDSFSLGENYAGIRELESRIAASEDAYEIDELMRHKLELMEGIERFHDQERAYARQIAALTEAIAALESSSASMEEEAALLLEAGERERFPPPIGMPGDDDILA